MQVGDLGLGIHKHTYPIMSTYPPKPLRKSTAETQTIKKNSPSTFTPPPHRSTTTSSFVPKNENQYWICKYRNLSYASYCECGAVATPVVLDEEEVVCLIYSFGSHTRDFGCRELNAPLLEIAIDALNLDNDTKVVIRTGTKDRKAILIKLSPGEYRLSLDKVPDNVGTEKPLFGSKNIAEFLVASSYILASDQDQTWGKNPAP